MVCRLPVFHLLSFLLACCRCGHWPLAVWCVLHVRVNSRILPCRGKAREKTLISRLDFFNFEWMTRSSFACQAMCVVQHLFKQTNKLTSINFALSTIALEAKDRR